MISFGFERVEIEGDGVRAGGKGEKWGKEAVQSAVRLYSLRRSSFLPKL